MQKAWTSYDRSCNVGTEINQPSSILQSFKNTSFQVFNCDSHAVIRHHFVHHVYLSWHRSRKCANRHSQGEFLCILRQMKKRMKGKRRGGGGDKYLHIDDFIPYEALEEDTHQPHSSGLHILVLLHCRSPL